MREPLQKNLHRDAWAETCPAEMFSSRLTAKIARARERVSRASFSFCFAN
jgi:hypothetical protein